ncbi:MAG: histidine phosphatase family protein [Eubacteriales bacterium]|nr:histidine phosphatase family protein [Eubacteriales bacterium]
MTRVYFIRHAEPNFNNHDDLTRELSAKGLEDRKRVTEFLLDKNIDVAISSPFKRAIDTIKDFTDCIGMEIVIIDYFRERKVDSGWIDDFTAFTRKQWEDFSFKLSDGECLQEVQERNVAALETVIEKYKGKNIIIGSHGTALSTVIQHFRPAFGYEDFARIKMKMPWIVEFEFDEAGKLIDMREHDLPQEISNI